jgi:spheroidene monooxygenase
MLTDRVIFSFFRYRASHSLPAFVFMGFQGLFRDRDMPPGPTRLMGCGSGDGFSIVPDFRTYCVMSAIPDDARLAQLRRTRWYRIIARPSIEQLHFVLRPLSGRGTWDGEPLFDYQRRPVGDAPFAVLTHARVTAARAPAFWRSVPAIRAHLQQARGCVYHIGFGEHPLLTLATFSIWDGLDHMRDFAYHHSTHHEVSLAARHEHWLSESMFVRFGIERIEGDLARYPALAALLPAAA